MLLETTRFGSLDVQDDQILRFPFGLPGFEDKRGFILVAHPSADPSPFQWLQSTEDGSLAFLVANPHEFFPDYHPKLPIMDLEAIGLEKNIPPPSLHCIITIPQGNPAGLSANLAAPLVINTSARMGRQVFASNEEYGCRHRLLS